MENRKKKTGLAIGIFAAAAVVIVVAAIIILGLISANPKQQLGKGLLNMAAEMKAYTTRISDDIDFKALAKAGKSQPVHSQVKLSFTNPEASWLVNNLSMEFDLVADRKNRQGKIDVKAGAYGFDMDIGSVIADNNTLYLTSDQFLNGDVYSVGLGNIGREFNDSVWAGYLNVKIPEDASITLFGDGNDDGADVDLSAFKEELFAILKKHLKEMALSGKYDKIKEKREFSKDGGSDMYGGVQLTIEKDAYNAAMENLKNDIFESSFYAQCIERYKKIGMDKFDIYKASLDKAVGVFTGMKAEGDVVLNFYIDKKGRIRSVATPENIPVSAVASEISSVSAAIDFAGGERALDSVEGGICYYTEADGQVLELGVSRAAGVTKDAYDEDLTLRLWSETTGDIIFSYINSWTYADKSYDMKIMMDNNYSSMRVTARGGYEDIKKGKGFSLRVDNASLNVDAKDVLIASGTALVEAGKDSRIEVPQNSTDVFKMSLLDVMAAAMKAASALKKFQ